MVFSDLKSKKYYRTMRNNVITYFEYDSIIKMIDENFIYLVCKKVIYFKKREKYYSKEALIQTAVNNNEILASIFPISKTIFYKAIRKYNVFRRTEKRKML